MTCSHSTSNLVSQIVSGAMCVTCYAPDACSGGNVYAGATANAIRTSVYANLNDADSKWSTGGFRFHGGDQSSARNGGVTCFPDPVPERGGHPEGCHTLPCAFIGWVGGRPSGLSDYFWNWEKVGLKCVPRVQLVLVELKWFGDQMECDTLKGRRLRRARNNKNSGRWVGGNLYAALIAMAWTVGYF